MRTGLSRCGLACSVLALCACVDKSSFSCTTNASCADPVRPGGICEPSGNCSFSDLSCQGGRRYSEYASGGLGGTCASVPGPPGPDGSAGPLFHEDFESLPLGTGWMDGSVHGQWTCLYGCNQIGIESDGTQVLTETGTAAGIATRQSFGDFDLTLRLKTVAQLRATPNSWEVASVFWHYVDAGNFYVFIPKTTGWEVDRKICDGCATDKRYLRTLGSPNFPVGGWHTIRIRQVQGTITVWADGAQLGDPIVDPDAPLLQGPFVLYLEQSHGRFDDMTVVAP